MGTELGRKALEGFAAIVKPETILAWFRKLVAKKFNGSKENRSDTGIFNSDNAVEFVVVQIDDQGNLSEESRHLIRIENAYEHPKHFEIRGNQLVFYLFTLLHNDGYNRSSLAAMSKWNGVGYPNQGSRSCQQLMFIVPSSLR